LGRIVRYFWFHFVMLLTAWLPDNTPFLRLRGFLARPAFKRCGRNLHIVRHVCVIFPNKVEIGRDVFLGYGSWINAGGGIVIEDEVQLAPYAVLIAGDHTLKGDSYRFAPGDRAPIRLCKGCWIGSHATVTKGVTIGAASLLAANAVATMSIPDHCIAGGVPARVLKQNVGMEERAACSA
jgi:acetyltransferase-like isoleucine patch superfamily enzyme